MSFVKFYIPEWVSWLARDNSGALYGYRNKPVRCTDMWGASSDTDDFEEVVVSFITDDLEHFPQVKWEDEEPHFYRNGGTFYDIDVDALVDAYERLELSEDDACAKIEQGTTEPDMVNTPPHYKQYSFEPIDIITEVVKEYPPEIGFHVGTVLKYLFRSPFKGKQEEDINKAAYYLARAIKELTDE